MSNQNIVDLNKEYFFGKKIIAFLDVLGFSKLVKNNPHTDLIKIYKSLIEYPVQFQNKMSSVSKKMHEEGRYGTRTFSGLRMTNVSDSIIVWIDNSHETSIIDLLYNISQLMSIGMLLGTPLRGAIVRGDFDILESNSSFSIIGKALVDAYETEKKQYWSGCIIDDSVFEKLIEYYRIFDNNNTPYVLTTNPHIVLRYNDVPIKEGNVIALKSKYVVNWCMYSFLNEDVIRNSFKAHNKGIDKDVETKIQNTLTYFNYCNANIKPPSR